MQMNRLREKCERPPFLGTLGKKGQFWTVFGKNGQSGETYQKTLGTFLSRLKALTKCKVSEKNKEWFPRKSVTYVGESRVSWTRGQVEHLELYRE